VAALNGDEILSLMRLGIFDRDKPADREIMLNLLDQPKETPMTWDGQPLNRNLGGDGEQPKIPFGRWRDFFGELPCPPVTPGEQPRQDGEGTQMPADPFGGVDEGAIATVEMFRAHVAAGLSEQQALFFCACLVQVGHVIQQGGLLPPDGT
jgi:hypothetical protein